MHHPRRPVRYVHRYPKRIQLSPRELLWRTSWPYIFTCILASLMFIFIIVIFILEIASLVNDGSNQLSNTASTGAGIWCSIFFLIPVVCMLLLSNRSNVFLIFYSILLFLLFFFFQF